MSKSPLLCGVDVGTGSVRALIIDGSGRVMASHSCPTPTQELAEDRAQYDADGLVATVCQVIRDAADKLGGQAGQIAGLAIASFGESGVLLDRHDGVLGPVLAWYDQRPNEAYQKLISTLGADAFERTTGLCPDPTFSAAKLAWAKSEQPERFARAASWLHVSDYLAFRLTGTKATDLGLAARTMLLDLAACRWSAELLGGLGLNTDLLPEILPLGTNLGVLTADAARQTGLPPHCQVALGGYDHVAGMLAAGADRPGHLFNSMGTAEAWSLAQSDCVIDQAKLRRGINHGALQVHGETPVFYQFGGLPTSAAAIDWFFETFAPKRARQLLIDAAAEVPPGAGGVSFYPHLRLGSPPYPDPQAGGGLTGLSQGTDHATLLRAVLEGVALDMAAVLAVLAPNHPPFAQVTAIGGSTRNALLMAIKASLLGQPIAVGRNHDATALGAALLAGLAIDVYPDLRTAQQKAGLRTGLATPLPNWPSDAIAAQKRDYIRGRAALRSWLRDEVRETGF